MVLWILINQLRKYAGLTSHLSFSSKLSTPFHPRIDKMPRHLQMQQSLQFVFFAVNHFHLLRHDLCLFNCRQKAQEIWCGGISTDDGKKWLPSRIARYVCEICSFLFLLWKLTDWINAQTMFYCKLLPYLRLGFVAYRKRQFVSL